MSYQFPYSYFCCPCTKNGPVKGGTGMPDQPKEDPEEEETFDPRSPRSNYSLYPLDHLMWCEDCHEMRCPRCTVEEVVCWYCPSCLFEVASSMVKSEGNRCTRNCFNCPTCTAPLSVNTLGADTGGIGGPWILACDYCLWTTLDINIQFEKPNNIYGQLARLQAGKPARPLTSRITSTSISDAPTNPVPTPTDHDSRFAALRTFYTSQLQKSGPSNPLLSPTGDINYNSPSSLARIMSIYTNTGSYGKKATKPVPMRAATSAQEGLLVHSPTADLVAVAQLRRAGWADTTSHEQRSAQPHAPRFISDLRPVATLLRTKRSRRCRECRHILVRPEAKVQSTRYRIKLVAMNYVPSMTLAPLPTGATAALDLKALPPSRPLQFLLTVRNPMFDAIKVTLATPASTPGRSGGNGSRVTVLSPQFEVGAMTEAFEEVLGAGAGAESRRASKMGLSSTGRSSEPESKIAEAGKVWEKGRNWTTVVVEVVCGRVEIGKELEMEDEDVLEIPVLVRIEYETEAGGQEGAAFSSSVDKEKREKRELAYWCVLGVGKIARVQA